MRKRVLWFRKFILTAIGLLIDQLQSKFVRWFLFPLICFKYGMLAGFLFLLVATSLIGYFLLRAYFNEQRVLKDEALFILLTRLLSRFNRFFVLIFMSTQLSPVVLTAYFDSSKRLNWKPVTIFLVSLVIGMLYTLLVVLLLKKKFPWLSTYL